MYVSLQCFGQAAASPLLPPRDAHRDPKTGEERFAVLKGNLYGDPNSARLWQKELFDWLESLDGMQERVPS